MSFGSRFRRFSNTKVAHFHLDQHFTQTTQEQISRPSHQVTKMGIKELCIAACTTKQRKKGHTLQAIKAYVKANNYGKCTASAVRKALAGDSFVQGATKARWVATDAAKESIKPKK